MLRSKTVRMVSQDPKGRKDCKDRLDEMEETASFQSSSFGPIEYTMKATLYGTMVRRSRRLQDTGTEPGSCDWAELAGRGADGKGFRVRGTYDASEFYEQHDVVMRNDASFVALKDVPGECPGRAGRCGR